MAAAIAQLCAVRAELLLHPDQFEDPKRSLLHPQQWGHRAGRGGRDELTVSVSPAERTSSPSSQAPT